MGRLFSIDVEFENKTHLALVNVRQKDEDLICQVRYMDGGLHYLLTDGLLIFDTNGVVKQPDCRQSLSVRSLVHSTVKAVCSRLKVHSRL